MYPSVPEDVDPGLYIIEFFPPVGEKKLKGLEMGNKIKGRKREKKRIWGK